jgi:hypothetical protein
MSSRPRMRVSRVSSSCIRPPVRAHGLLRLQGRLDQDEAFAFALGLEIRGKLRFHLFLLHFGVLFLGIGQVAHQCRVIALDGGCGGAAPLEFIEALVHL